LNYYAYNITQLLAGFQGQTE